MVLFGTHRVICTQCLMHCLNDVYLNVEISIPIYLFYFNGRSIIRTILSALDDFITRDCLKNFEGIKVFLLSFNSFMNILPFHF